MKRAQVTLSWDTIELWYVISMICICVYVYLCITNRYSMYDILFVLGKGFI